MPFPGLTSLGFTAKEDSKYFTETQTDPTIRGEYEGGFVVTRPRFTRVPPRVITTGFSDLTDTQKQLLFTYYENMRGGAISFTYNHPVTNAAMTVRFREPFTAKYVGVGTTYRWDVADIKLEQI